MSQPTQPPSMQPITAQEAKGKAQEKGQELKGQAGSRVREEVESRSTQAGEGAQSLAQTLRRTGAELRNQGQEGQAAVLDQVAIRAEQTAAYLTQSDPDRILSDAKEYGNRAKEYGNRARGFAQQKPWLVAGGGLALGLLGSRVLRSLGGS